MTELTFGTRSWTVTLPPETIRLETTDPRIDPSRRSVRSGVAAVSAETVAAMTRRALAEQNDGLALPDLIFEGDRVAITLDRPCLEASTILQTVLAVLTEAAVKPEDVTILLAPEIPVEVVQSVATALPSVTVRQHHPRKRGEVGYLAATRSGEPVMLATALLEADVIVPITVRPLGSVGGVGLFPAFSDGLTRTHYGRNFLHPAPLVGDAPLEGDLVTDEDQPARNRFDEIDETSQSDSDSEDVERAGNKDFDDEDFDDDLETESSGNGAEDASGESTAATDVSPVTRWSDPKAEQVAATAQADEMAYLAGVSLAIVVVTGTDGTVLGVHAGERIGTHAAADQTARDHLERLRSLEIQTLLATVSETGEAGWEAILRTCDLAGSLLKTSGRLIVWTDLAALPPADREVDRIVGHVDPLDADQAAYRREAFDDDAWSESDRGFADSADESPLSFDRGFVERIERALAGVRGHLVSNIPAEQLAELPFRPVESSSELSSLIARGGRLAVASL